MISLWREAFGDTEEEVAFFLDNCNHAECVGLFQDGELKAMLFLVQCTLDKTASYYIYAACTAKAFRNRGAMSQLLNYCKENYRHLCLIPASDTLVSYYRERGFEGRKAIAALAFDESEEIKEYLLEGYQLTEPTALYYERI